MDYRMLTQRMRQATKRRPPLSAEVKRVIFALMITLGSLFLMISGLFLYQASKSTEQGFLLRQTKLEYEKLESENRELKQKVLQVQSINNISESKVLQKMEETVSPVYVPKNKVTLEIAR